MSMGCSGKESKETYQDNRKAVYTNRPVDEEAWDFFRMDILSKEIKGAIDDEAGLIGIISDFGEGKSSLLRYLAKEEDDDKYQYQLCSICMWNFYGSEDKDNMETVSAMTHSFLYQLARGLVTPEFARHVNRMFSRNYGMISFDIYPRKHFWHLLIAFAVVALLAGIVYAVPVSMWGKLSSVHDLAKLILENMVHLVSAAVVLLLVRNRENIVFSGKGSQGNRTPGLVDSYEIFDYIISKAPRELDSHPVRYLICIEDLDRAESYKDVVRFLKEIYRYHNMLSPDERKNFIFIVMTSQRLYENTKGNASETFQGESLEQLYSKIFYYTIELRPIAKSQQRQLVLTLMEKLGSSADFIIDKDNDIRERAAELICKGDNLGIRDLKNRLDKALSIKKYLNAMQIRTAEFDKCAAVAYLEDQYPMDMYYLAHEQEKFAGFMQAIKGLETNDSKFIEKCKACAAKHGYYGIEHKGKIILERERFEKEKRVYPRQAFMDEWFGILSKSNIAQDYEIYFFRQSDCVKNSDSGQVMYNG